MIIPLFIDTSSLAEDFNLDQADCDNIVDFAVKEITLQFAKQWEMTALNELGSTKSRYVSNLSVIDEGRLQGAVVLNYANDPLIQMLEEGASPFDMKSNFAKSSKVKFNKSGGWYLSIPFTFGTPNSINDSDTFSNVMPIEVYNIAKKLAPKQQITNKQLSSLQGGFEAQQTRAKIDIPKSKQFEEYTHKSSIYKGISKSKDSTSNGSGYVSFRRVSENSAENSWIHKGFIAKDIASKALSDFEMKIEPLMTQAIDNALSSMGLE